jgi:GT2 family glycosyltransferase
VPPTAKGPRDGSLGLVVIGRNEGERLRRCLLAIGHEHHGNVVYVDSGSTDQSVALARSLGITAIELDLDVPFTAGRARNAGLQGLLGQSAQVRYVQFLDGDCELVAHWLQQGVDFLDAHPDHAAVAGRVLEKYPGASIYNQLCQWEWDVPEGDAKACGGNALFRVDALGQVGGFDSRLIAGEEPELCVRLRARGWRVHRLAFDMVHHDAAMTRFTQWWKRSMRAGYAFAEGAWMHGALPERHWVKETARAAVWGGLYPAVILLAVLVVGQLGLLGLLVYPLQVVRLARGPGGWRRAVFLTLGKFAECAGVVRFYLGRWARRPGAIIEYK